jgi:hypothetical protein
MVFANVWPLSGAVSSSSSSSNGAGPAVSTHTSAAAVSSTMPAPVHHHHVEPAAAPVVVAVPVQQHPALAPEALLDAVNEGSVAQVHAILARDPSLANHRDGFGQVRVVSRVVLWAVWWGEG